MYACIAHDPFLTAMIKAAFSASVTIRDYWENLASLKIEIKNKNARDLVSGVDRASEGIIRKILTDAFPGCAFYGEESVKEGQKIDPEVPTFSVDPLDGTSIYLSGINFLPYAISIALMKEGKAKAGIIYNISSDTLYVASDTVRAFQYRKHSVDRTYKMLPLHASARLLRFAHEWPKETKLNPIIVGMQAKMLAHQSLKDMQTPVTFGCASVGLALVAAGGLAGYTCLNFGGDWDITGALPLLGQSGCVITDLDGNTWEPRGHQHSIIAGANADIHQIMLEIVQEVLSEMDLKIVELL